MWRCFLRKNKRRIHNITNVSNTSILDDNNNQVNINQVNINQTNDNTLIFSSKKQKDKQINKLTLQNINLQLDINNISYEYNNLIADHIDTTNCILLENDRLNCNIKSLANSKNINELVLFFLENNIDAIIIPITAP